MLRGITDKLGGRARGRNEWKNGYRESQSEMENKILIYLWISLPLLNDCSIDIQHIYIF